MSDGPLISMKMIKRMFGAVALTAAVVVVLVWIEHAVSKPNMTEFNPREMGRLEAPMWRSYYEKRWLRLTHLTREGACGQFGYSGTHRGCLCMQGERRSSPEKKAMTRGVSRIWSNTLRLSENRPVRILISAKPPRWNWAGGGRCVRG
jgi:hypothetical protein